MAIVRIGDHFEFKKIHSGNPLFLSRQNAYALYRTISENQNSPQFVVTRTKPTKSIEATCCYWVIYVYDVTLFSKHLCTVYESKRYFVNGSKYEVNVVEFQGEHYNIDELMDYNHSRYFGDIIVARWKRDEEKRKATLKQQTDANAQDFLSFFAKEKQYQ